MNEPHLSIAFLHEYFPCGGGERVTSDIACHLQKKGLHTYIFCKKHYPEKDTPETENHYTICRMPNAKRLNTSSNLRYISSILQRENIRILILVYNRFSGLAYLRKNNPDCKLVFAHHGMPFWEIEDKEEKLRRKRQKPGGCLKWILVDFWKYRLFRFHERSWRKSYLRMYRQTDAYTVLCEEYRNEIIRTLDLPETEQKIHAISNPERLPPQVCPDKQKEVLFVGRMSHADKRIDRLLRIWKRAESACPDWKLTLVGDGPELENLKRMSHELSLHQVEFSGYRRDTTRYYRRASILCLTSSFEGWPLCLTEAQANGVVPVAFACCAGIKAICTPGECGILVDPFDEEAYARELIGLMKNDARLLKMQQAARRKAHEYAIEKVGMQWLRLFDALLSDSASS